MTRHAENDAMKLETIRFEKPVNGYAPSDDSWLLAKSVQECVHDIRGKKCVDMGCGSGIQTAALLISGASDVQCVDINPSAITNTLTMVEKYFPHANVKGIEGNLFEHVKGTFDVIVFNPPYVPSEEIKWREVDGGKKGREIIDQFLKQFSKHVKPNGICLLLQSSLNGTEETQIKIQQMGFDCTIIASQKLAFEELLVLKITAK